ncbi:TonB-dependent receptor family protein [Roseibium aggregatum]|uniref:TonB-dependent receptor n=1 Tax=Roseibium aggregatum TaxID=187304 RepID=A0A939EHS1_9HYPH|nr:TonB-dependent receptor [Roseibium aggregatum]MBN9672682.1 TonB-dependent receptor [Roseibium aggregatum]
MISACSVFLSATLLSSPALPQSAAPGTTILLDTIEVLDDSSGQDVETARQRLNEMTGATAIVDRSRYEGQADVSLKSAIGAVPGVVVQNFFGGNDQPRLQIRGSGLQQSPVERGVLVLKDGLPLNRADGSYVIGLIDPAQANYIEVYRGHTANRLGTSVLGGALNFVSPTGQDERAEATVTGGSFGEAGGLFRYGKQIGRTDFQGQLSYDRRDGFRDHNESERLDINANAGHAVNDIVSTRFFAGFTDLRFDIPGPLTEDALNSDPTQIYGGPTVTVGPGGPTVSNPGPNVQRDKPYRDTQQFRLGNRTTARLGAHLYEAGLGFAYTDDAFMAPIAAGLKETEGGDITGVLKYAYAPDASQVLPLFESTAYVTYGGAERKFYQNVEGEKGELIGDNDLTSLTTSLHGAFNLKLSERFKVVPSVAFTYANRMSDDNYGSGTRPVTGFNPVTGARQSFQALSQDTSYSRHYAGISPALGLSYDLGSEKFVFASVSRSFEPPTHDDLLSTANGTPFYGPGAPSGGAQQYAFSSPDLEAQTATTIEAGTRGRFERLGWDATVYYTWINDELLSLRDASGTQLAARNADETRHFGVEMGLSADLTEALSARLSYTYQDFRFHNDATHGNNRLAGAPDHILNAALRYTFMPGLFLETEVNWLPGSTPVDNANTAFAGAWVTVDARGGYRINEHFSLQGEITNIFDETYASSVLVTDTANAGQASYLPSDGRAFRLSLTARF